MSDCPDLSKIGLLIESSFNLGQDCQLELIERRDLVVVEAYRCELRLVVVVDSFDEVGQELHLSRSAEARIFLCVLPQPRLYGHGVLASNKLRDVELVICH